MRETVERVQRGEREGRAPPRGAHGLAVGQATPGGGASHWQVGTPKEREGRMEKEVELMVEMDDGGDDFIGGDDDDDGNGVGGVVEGGEGGGDDEEEMEKVVDAVDLMEV